MSNVWDVIVAGGGPAGAVAARDLARHGHRVLMVDAVSPGQPKVGESLPGSARPLLRALGLLSHVEAGPHWPYYGNVSAWGSSTLMATDSITDPHGPGWHLDRPAFDAALRSAAEAAGVVWQPAWLRSAEAIAGGWRVRLSRGTAGGGPVRARWLIDATGRAASVARSLGARRHQDDTLVALCTWMTAPDTDVDRRTLVEATPDGWWYTARLPGPTRVVVLHVDAHRAAALRHTPGLWHDALAQTTHVRTLLADATALPFGLRGGAACGACLTPATGRRWVATGDAALSFDPLSSQGILTALHTGLKAGRAVHAARSGVHGALAAYEARLAYIRATYLQRHRHLYQAERRWPARRFWLQRRLSPQHERPLKQACHG